MDYFQHQGDVALTDGVEALTGAGLGLTFRQAVPTNAITIRASLGGRVLAT
jgi:hypothetical protein